MSRSMHRPATVQYPQSYNVPYSSRSTYPTFLSLQETALLQLNALFRGLLDAFRWDNVIRLVVSDPEIRSNVFKSLLLNTVSLLSIYFFDLLLAPLARGQQNWLHRNVGWFYQVLWLFPVVGASLYLNTSWCTLLAKRTYTLQHGSRSVAPQPSSYTGILNSIATSAYRVVMVFTSVVVTFGLNYVPFIGPTAGFIFMCWIDSYYFFEFIWVARGLSLSRRLRHLEERWAYYFAFGLPSAALCMWGSSLANAALFALVFPAYIIMAMHSRPIPQDPYNPSGSDGIRHPSPLIPIRMPVFSLVMFLNDLIVRIITLGGRIPGSGGTKFTQHRRAMSDSVESIEEGEAIALESVGSTPAPPLGPKKPRIRLGTRTSGMNRRKLD